MRFVKFVEVFIIMNYLKEEWLNVFVVEYVVGMLCGKVCMCY